MSIFAAIASIAGAVSAIYGIFGLLEKWFGTTPAQTDQGIDQQEQANKQQAEQGGRPV